MMVEISNGELLDKLSILKIKMENISDETKLVNIFKEYKELDRLSKNLLSIDGIADLFNKLYDINVELWKTEDLIRGKEKLKQFDKEFVFYARNVYITNDLRFTIKKEINEKTNSNFVEEKSYDKY